MFVYVIFLVYLLPYHFLALQFLRKPCFCRVAYAHDDHTILFGTRIVFLIDDTFAGKFYPILMCFLIVYSTYFLFILDNFIVKISNFFFLNYNVEWMTRILDPLLTFF